jgi:hypothetical protein
MVSEHCEFIHMASRTQIELDAVSVGYDSVRCTLRTWRWIDVLFVGRLRSGPCVFRAFIAITRIATPTPFRGRGCLRVCG